MTEEVNKIKFETKTYFLDEGDKVITPDCVEGRLSLKELEKKYFVKLVVVMEKPKELWKND